jgi:3-oxoacyl-[acyl-carrier-protein] synthase III
MLYLHALGHFHPETLISNAFLESLDIGTDEAWILDRVGIRQRHTVLPLDYIRSTLNRDPRGAQEAATLTNGQTGARAALMALDRAGRAVSEVGLVLSGSCSPDECIPAEANRVAQALGVDAPALDLSSACSSFASQLYFLEAMRPEKLPDFILVVNPENSTRVVDYSDRSTCVLWGDCSTAALVSPRIPGPWKVTETRLSGDPSGAEKVRVPRLGHFTQQGSVVQKFAIQRTAETLEALREVYLARNPAKTEAEVDFIGHQANLRMLESVARRCRVPAGRHHYNVDARGNVGSAGAPSVLSERWGTQALGDAVALCVVGSGLTWAGVLLERTGQS